MKVFLPFTRSRNKYFDEIENHFQGQFIYGSLDDYKEEYEIVNIHWPEYIFEWKEPTNNQLIQLKNHFKKWKKHSKIVYTLHDEKNHYKESESFDELFKLVFENCDAIIHLSKYSLNKYTKFFPNKEHTVIEHPLYTTIPNNSTRNEAKEFLNINKNSKVILIFGQIRTYAEQKMILRSFKKIHQKNIVFLVARFPYIPPSYIPNFLKEKYRSLMFRFFKIKKRYFFGTEFVNVNNIQYFLNASDVVYIARKNTLNSGNIPLAITFNKIAVGPNTGNMGEILDELNFPKFEPDNINSIVKELKTGIAKSDEFIIPIETVQKLDPKNISEKYYRFLLSLIQDK